MIFTHSYARRAEIFRAYDATLFSNCEIYELDAGYLQVKDFVAQAQQCEMNVYGVVDENRRATIDKYVTAFPEDTAPEISIFHDEKTKKEIIEEFQYTFEEQANHHNYFEKIAKYRNEDIAYVKNRCIKLYIKNKGLSYYQNFLDQMNKWLNDCN